MNINAGRVALIHNLIDQLVAKRTQIKIPKKLNSTLAFEVEAAGGAEAWLIKQPEYCRLMAEKSSRQVAKKRKNKSNKNKQGSPAHSSKIIAVAFSQPNLKTGLFPNARQSIMNLVVDAILSGSGVPDNDGMPDKLKAEMAKVGGPFEWVRLQPNYLSTLQARQKQFASKAAVDLIEHKVRKFIPPQEDSSRFCSADLVRRGKLRTKIRQGSLGLNEMEAIYLVVGTLPVSPLAPSGNGKEAQALRTKIRQAWLQLMGRPQKSAWNKLRPEKQNEYLSFGRITVSDAVNPRGNATAKKTPERKIEPINNAPVTYIVEKANRSGDSDWSIYVIDWSST